MHALENSNLVLMLTEKSSHCLSFYDAGTGTLLDSIDLPRYPHEFTVDAAQRYAYVGHYGIRTSADTDAGGSSVLVIDIARRTLLRTLDCKPYRRLHGIMLDGSDRLHVLSEAENAMLRFDEPLVAQVPSAIAPTGGVKSHLFAVTRDGEWAFCMNLLSNSVTRISPADPKVAPVSLSPGRKPEGICLSPDEKTLFVSNRDSSTIVAIDTATMQIDREAPARPDPARLYRAPNERLLVVNYTDKSLSLVDQISLEPIGFIELHGRPTAASVHPASNQAFVSVDTDECLRVDLHDFKLTGAFNTKSEPDCSAILG